MVPGRAGGGAELARLAGLKLYMQEAAVQGARGRCGAVDALVSA